MKYYLLTILILICLAFFFYNHYDIFFYFAILSFLMITIMPFVKKLKNNNLDLFEISFIFVCGYLFIYFLGTIAMYIFLKETFQIDNTSKIIINKMIILYIIGIIFYYFGYHFKINFKIIRFIKYIIKIPYIFNESKLFYISILFYLIGLNVFLFSIFKFGFSYFLEYSYIRSIIFQNSNYLFFLIQFSIPSFLIIFSIYLKKKYILFLPILLLIILIFINFLLGGRFRTVSILIMLISIYYYLQRKSIFKKIIFLFISIFLIFISISIIRYFNSIYLIKNNIKDIVLSNLDYPFYFYKIIINIPFNISYQYGKTFVTFLFYPLPRALFPQKPLSAGSFITQYLFPYLKYSSVPPTILGELYLNFSYFGIMIGMFIIGILHKIIYEYFNLNKEKLSYIIFYSIIIPFVFWCNFLDFTLTLVYLFYLLIPFLLIIFISRDVVNEKNKNIIS